MALSLTKEEKLLAIIAVQLSKINKSIREASDLPDTVTFNDISEVLSTLEINYER